MPKKQKPVAERQQETRAVCPAPPPGVLDNWPDTGPGVAGPERALTWAGEPLRAEASQPPEPKGKLGT
jgi:hypothetical protein